MKDSNQPPPIRRSSFFLEDLVVAAVRGIDYVSNSLRQPLRLRRSDGGPPVPPKKAPKPKPRQIVTQGADQEGGVHKRVLLVESEPLTRLMLIEKLQAAGLQVEVAPDLGGAFQHLRVSFPDAIFMEMVSGGIHASELIREARRNPIFSTRPIYVYTCQGFNAAPGGVAGADKVFNKLSSPAQAVVDAFLAELKLAEPAPPLPLPETDLATLEQIPTLLRQQVSQIVAQLHAQAQKSSDVEACTVTWKELRNCVRGLVSGAAVAGRRDLARQTAAIEAFLKELNAEPNHVAANSWQTLCSAAEVLDVLVDEPQAMEQPQPTELTAVVVDETLDSRMDTTQALLNAGFAAVSFSKTTPALKHFESHSTDLLVLPLGLNGLEQFCEAVRDSVRDRCVIFVNPGAWEPNPPQIASSQLCANSLSGPHLGLKALTLVQQHRRRSLSAEALGASVETVEPAPLPESESPTEPSLTDSQAGEGQPTDASVAGLESISEPDACPTPETTEEQGPDRSQGAPELQPDPTDLCEPETALNPESNALEDSDPLKPEPGLEPDPSQETVMQPNYKHNPGKMQPIPSDIPDLFFKNDAAPTGEASAPVSPGPAGKPVKAAAGLADFPDVFLKGPSAPGAESEPDPAQEPAAAAESADGPAQGMPWPEPPSPIEARAAKADTDFARRGVDKPRESVLLQAYANGMEQQRLEAVQEAGARKQLENQIQALVAANALLERRLMEQNRSHDEMARYSAELQEKLQAAEAADAKDITRYQRMEEEMAEFRRERDNLRDRWLTEQQTGLDSQRRFQDLENNLRERTAELEQARLDLQREFAERTRLEIERDEEKPATPGALTMPGSGTMKRAELERQLREKVSELAQATAELENEKGERRRCEQRAAALAAQLQSLHAELSQHLEAERSTHQRIAGLEQRVLEREQTISQVRSELQKETADRRLAEEELRTATELGRQMQNNLALYEETRRMFKNTQDQLESKLKGSLAALNDHEAKLQKESSERRRLVEALDESQRLLKDQSQTSSLELSKAQSGMQLTNFEKKCLEAELLRTRQDSVTSARANRAAVHNLRQQLKQPVDNLYLFACQLLRKELPDEQKKVAQVLLENALLLQTTLRETEPLPVSSSESTGEDSGSTSSQ